MTDEQIQQMAEKEYPLMLVIDDEDAEIAYIHSRERDAYIAGAKAMRDSIQNDAMDFAEWIVEIGYYASNEKGVWYIDRFDSSRNKTTNQLYELFKQSKNETK